MKKYINKSLIAISFCLCITFLTGCFAVNDSGISKRAQNLSARYNYIYNSNVLLDKYNEEQLYSYQDNYEHILPVYLDPPPQTNIVLTPGLENKDLDKIIVKGQTIINEKTYSNYIDDAYMLLGKAQYLKGNYFIAAEYFDYVASTYKSDLKVYIMGLNWKARSQMILNNMDKANTLIDTMLRACDLLKKDLPEPLATTAQMRIYEKKYPEAITLLNTAIRLATDKQLRIRWQYILAQLQEKENDLQNAFITYTKVENSNAPFEMYFHANLNRVKLKALISGYKLDEEKQLLALIKDDKNLEYIDQIYYQIGEMFSKEGNFVKAETYYIKSTQEQSKNANQKALSFLKIADLNFKTFGNYVKAKNYYDSTVVALPKNFPDYDAIVKKANNLQFLTDRYTIISTEDTLQNIAKLPEVDRAARIKKWLKPIEIVEKAKNLNNETNANPIFTDQNLNIGQNNSDKTTATFYFNNTSAISNGFSDFKKRWGNRKLEDNWRQSLKSASAESNQILAGGLIANDIKIANDTSASNANTQQALEKKFLEKIPTTPQLLNASNASIIDAYFQIASFYQQELNDKVEANKVYEILLNRFPDNKYLDAIYYSLYLNYKNIDQNRSTEYSNLVTQKFPNSDFAKSIVDPNYSVKQNQIEDKLNNDYNAIYEVFSTRNYPDVIHAIDQTLQSYPTNHLASQYAYLRAISIGRTQKVDALLGEFNKIVSDYPTDVLITPLVKEHLAYINSNVNEFKQRRVALVDIDPSTKRFIEPTLPEIIEIPKVIANVSAKDIVLKSDTNKLATIQNLQPKIDTAKSTIVPAEVKEELIAPIETINGIKSDGLFNNEQSDKYYYVIAVRDVSIRLSSSRFGIGQFNRGNYPKNELIHKLIEFDEDQLIYINSFADIDDALVYEKSITPQLKNIMKVPANTYTGFIITKENFEKLTDRKTIERYLEFYKNSY